MSKFLTDWKNTQAEVLKTMYPTLSYEEIHAKLDKIIEKRLVNPSAMLHNNYENKAMKTDLLSVIDWLDRNKPIICSSGVFFKNQHQEINPAAKMLEKFLKTRKFYKNQLPDHPPTSAKYKDLDLSQLTEKINANSYYGASGAKSSRFFNLYSAISTTATGQSLISTAQQCIEGFLSNNNPFYNLDECFTFISRVVSRPHKSLLKIKPHTIDEILERYKTMFFEYKEEYTPLILKYLSNIPQSCIDRLYYINNFYGFILDHEEVSNILINILEICEDFKDPNKPPKDALNHLNKLWSYMDEYVLYDRLIYNRINRLKYELRKSITVVDTDSVMVQTQPFIDLINDKLRNNSEILIVRDDNELKFATVNTLCYLISKLFAKMMWHFAEVANIPEEERARINLKNEFLFSIQILANVKKRYINLTLLREGDLLNPPKDDIKGFDFIKSTTSEDVKNLYKDIIKKHILFADKPEIAEILRKCYEFEQEIHRSIEAGEKKYMTPCNVSEIESYKFPDRIAGIRGVLAYNAIYEQDGAGIQLPEKCDGIKVNLDTIEQMEKLKEINEEVYNRLMKGIFHSKDEAIRKKGVNYLCIPRNVAKIPDWAIPFIDKDEIANKLLSKFHGVLESLGLELFASSKANHHSNIIQL